MQDSDDKVRMNFSPKLMKSLADRINLLKISMGAFKEKKQQDAFIRIAFDVQKKSENHFWFAEKLSVMYQKWAHSRKMKLNVLKSISNHRLLKFDIFTYKKLPFFPSLN